MSVAKSLRAFLVAIPGHSFGQIYQQSVPENVNIASGFIWYARRNTTPLRTLDRASGPNEQQFFDIEIYHENIDNTESFADLLQTYDGYRGSFGSGKIQGMFVDGQTDDYVPQVDMTATQHLSSSFLSIEIRSYRE
jgi:hypothetical protein